MWLRQHHLRTTSFLEGPQGQSVMDTPDMAVFLWQFHSTTIAFITVYLDCSIGTQGVNEEKMVRLWRITKALAVPWIALGDMNTTPAEMQKTEWLGRLGAELLLPQQADQTCANGRRKGRLIDYGFCSIEAKQHVRSLQVVHEVPWGPHLGLCLALSARPKKPCR